MMGSFRSRDLHSQNDASYRFLRGTILHIITGKLSSMPGVTAEGMSQSRVTEGGASVTAV